MTCTSTLHRSRVLQLSLKPTNYDNETQNNIAQNPFTDSADGIGSGAQNETRTTFITPSTILKVNRSSEFGT